MQAARYEKRHGTEAFWKVVEDGGLSFWSDMSWNIGGKKLWKYIAQYNAEILSAQASVCLKTCIKGKRIWISRLRITYNTFSFKR